MSKPLTAADVQYAVDAVAEYGGLRPASRALRVGYSLLHLHYTKARAFGLTPGGGEPDDSPDDAPIVRGRVKPGPRLQLALPAPGEVARYIFTCAQNNTHLHLETWENLLALAKYYHASVHVSTFSYDTASYGKKAVKRGREAGAEARGELWWDPLLEPYFSDAALLVAPGLAWCGEMNILPTAVRPLSGLESYTGRKSGIVPHVKFAMETVASGKFEGTKFMFTTGTVTQRNYIAKKEGLKAEFHHGYGGLLVEVDSHGHWWCRQLNADSEGVIHDLTLRVENGIVSEGAPVEAIQWGDIHVGRIRPEMIELLWGTGGMIDVLCPRYQFMEDVLDWRARNHHEMKNPHTMFERFVTGKDDVFAELVSVALFLKQQSFRKWCQTVVVRSNHDEAFDRWLREADYKADPKNALFFLKAQVAMYEAIAAGHYKTFLPIEWAMNYIAKDGMPEIRFLRQDESFIICADANGGIEQGHHGDKGANGANGSLAAFAKSGRKINTGDRHSPGIYDGAYRAGVAGDLDHGYNKGMSSWANSHIITYRNGKRAIVTVWAGKWRA